MPELSLPGPEAVGAVIMSLTIYLAAGQGPRAGVIALAFTGGLVLFVHGLQDRVVGDLLGAIQRGLNAGCTPGTPL